MDLTPTREQEDLRAEVRAWLQANLPWEYGTGLPPHVRRSRRGGLVPPRLAGAGSQPPVGSESPGPSSTAGRGLGPAENFVVQEELARARAPELVGRIGINLAGPDPPRARHPRAEAQVPAADPPRRCPLVPALQRARRRLRSRFCEDPGHRDRRRLVARRARRSGPPTPSSPTGGSASPGPARPKTATVGSPSSSSTCTTPASRFVRSAS